MPGSAISAALTFAVRAASTAAVAALSAADAARAAASFAVVPLRVASFAAALPRDVSLPARAVAELESAVILSVEDVLPGLVVVAALRSVRGVADVSVRESQAASERAAAMAAASMVLRVRIVFIPDLLWMVGW
jgi:hypothetical protein